MAQVTYSLEERFQHLKDKIQSPNFQHNQGLSNEVGYYIFDYPVTETLKMRTLLKRFLDSPMAAQLNIRCFNVFDIMIKEIKSFDYLVAETNETDGAAVNELEKVEERNGMDYLIEQVGNIMEITKEDNAIVKYIQNRLPKNESIIFITGLGEVYPLLRTHKILNAMTQVIDNYPVIFFYPGKYDSFSLQAFGEVKDQNYYRAFRID